MRKRARAAIHGFAHQFGVDGKKLLPVIFECCNYKSGSSILRDAIEITLSSASGVRGPGSGKKGEEMLKNAAYNGSLLIFIDGYDEIPESLRDPFRKDLDEVLGLFPNAKVIMACRPLPGGEDIRFIAKGKTFIPAFLDDFSVSNQSSLLRKLKEHTSAIEAMELDEIERFIQKNDYVKQLARNPYLLLCVVYNYAGDVFRIVEAVIKLLVNRHMNLFARSMHEARFLSSTPDENSVSEMFMELALEAAHASRRIVTEKMLKAFLDKQWAVNDAIKAWEQTRMMLGCRAGLLVASDGGYMFLADVLKWHLAAKAIVDQMDLSMLENIKDDVEFSKVAMIMLVMINNREDDSDYEFEEGMSAMLMERAKRPESNVGDKEAIRETLKDILSDEYGQSRATSKLVLAESKSKKQARMQRNLISAFLGGGKLDPSLVDKLPFCNHREFSA